MSQTNQNNVILVNPNDAVGKGLPADFKVTQPDDLTIFVELTTQKKSRSRIVFDGTEGSNENTSPTKGKVNFISGSPFGKNNSLTTSYTDIGSASLQSKDANLEGFGIESIDITFDTAYTPLIKIKFVDVRGGMFQRGGDSKYSVFFELPYPLFNLKVKGYYGRTVSYCLHLVKWNSLFNSNTGNFEIDAEFIGYTFAILTDLLIGFMRAAPYVDGIGDSAFKNVKERYEAVLNQQGNLAGNSVITIDEMFKKISDFQKSLNQINIDSPAYKQLVNVKKSVDVINNIKNRNNKFRIELQKDKNNININQSDSNVNQSDIEYIVSERKDLYSSYTKDMEDLIRQLDELVTGITDEERKILTSAIKTSKLQLSDFIDQNGDLLPNANETLLEKIDQEPKYDLENSKDRNRVTNILNSIKNINSNITTKNRANNGFYIYDFIKYANVYNSIVNKNNNQQNQLILKYQEELRGKLINNYDFNPSVQNIFRILMASAETFLLSVQKVADDALNNESRSETLKQIIKSENSNRENGITDIKKDTDIHPFPQYVKKDGANGRYQVEEAWIGSNTLIDTSVVDEIIYTEKLLSALIKLKQSDIDNTIDLNNSSAWFSVNPLDTPINQQTLNPYYRLSTSGRSVIDEDYLRLLMYRTFAYLGLTNPYSLDGDVLEYMAKFEANNLYYGFPRSDYNTANKLNKTSIYNNYSDANSIINHWLSGSDKIRNYLNETDKIPYMVANNDTYNYRYIYSDRTKAAYIPVSGGYSGEEFFRGEFLKNQIELSDVTNSFLGNYVNCDISIADKVDESAKYLDIIPYTRYDSVSYVLPTDRSADLLGDDERGYNKTFNDAKLTESSIKGSDETKQFDPIKYKFYSNEFFSLNGGTGPLSEIVANDKSDISAAFIDNPDKNKGTRLSTTDKDNGQNVQLYNKLISQLGDNDDIIVPDIAYVSINTTGTKSTNSELSTFSLFGSPFYYAQNAIQDETIRNYSKSYLFLNTLPLKGLYGKNPEDSIFAENSLIKGIFTKNGGFIKTPSLWVAWVGSILWRYDIGKKQNVDPIITKARYGGVSNIISLVRASNDGENKHELVMPTTNQLFFSENDVVVSTKAPMFFKLLKNGNEYKDIDKVLLNLPEQAKDTFIDFFKNWSDNSFKRVKDEYELFTDNSISINFIPNSNDTVDMLPWGDYLNQLKQSSPNGNGEYSPQFFQTSANNDVNDNALDNLNGFDNNAVFVNVPDVGYTGKTFYLPYVRINLPKEKNGDYNPAENSGNILMRHIFSDTSIIINYTPRTFNYIENATNIDTVNGRRDITIPNARLQQYLGFFVEEYKRLYEADEEAEVDTAARDTIFNSNNTDFIKLNIYRHLKSVNDKWIYDTKDISSLLSPCGDSLDDTLISRFLFIDKNWEEIGDEFIINPIVTEELIRSRYNQSLYDVISNILSQNNFNFIPLPNYVEYTEPNDMLENIFKPYPYIDMVKTNNTSVGPKFICMYVGQSSNHLDIKDSDFPNDGLNLDTENGLSDLTKIGKPIPAFEVNYGTQNQNFFKDLKLDQREFVETQESLEIIDRISNSGDKNLATFASQNLFNIYQTRSYSAEVTALGMPLIQPMMYFQLNNVPMFRGAYVIINTSHSIKPNHMTTTFKGVRVKKESTPINKQVIAIKDLNILESDLGVKYDINDSFIGDNDPTEGVNTVSGGGRTSVTSRNPNEQCGMASFNDADVVYPRSTTRGGNIIPYITIENRPKVRINLNEQPIVQYVKTIVTPKDLVLELERVINKIAPNAKSELKKKVLTSAYAISVLETSKEGSNFRGFNNNLNGVESSGFKVFNTSDVNGRVQLPENDAQGNPTNRIKNYYSFSNLSSGLVPVVTSIMDRNMYALQNGEAGANEFAWRYFRDWNGYGAQDKFSSDCTLISSAESAYKKSLSAINQYSTI